MFFDFVVVVGFVARPDKILYLSDSPSLPIYSEGALITITSPSCKLFQIGLNWELSKIFTDLDTVL